MRNAQAQPDAAPKDADDYAGDPVEDELELRLGNARDEELDGDPVEPDEEV